MNVGAKRGVSSAHFFIHGGGMQGKESGRELHAVKKMPVE